MRVCTSVRTNCIQTTGSFTVAPPTLCSDLIVLSQYWLWKLFPSASKLVRLEFAATGIVSSFCQFNVATTRRVTTDETNTVALVCAENDKPMKGLRQEDTVNQDLITELRKEFSMTHDDFYMVLTDADMRVKVLRCHGCLRGNKGSKLKSLSK